MNNRWSCYARALIRVFYPEECPLCSDGLAPWEDRVCSNCHATLTELRAPNCLKCSRELPPFGPGRAVCSQCRPQKFFFERTWALYAYNDALKQILHEIKFRRRKFLLNLFRRRLEEFGKHLPDRFDLILPVPVDRKRGRMRGFNQSALIASFLSKGAKKPLWETCLRKRRSTEPQSLLPREMRLVSLRDSFQARFAFLLRNRSVLLVDDVYTTGATVNECARVLKEKGARRVSVFCLARAVPDSS